MRPDDEQPLIRRPAPYEQIASRYRAQIMAGELPNGAELPSLRQLAATWDTTPNTAARALGQLQSEGLVRVGHHGAIVTVSDTMTYSPKDRAMAASGGGAIYPLSDKSQCVAAKLEQAPDHVATALGVVAHSPVVQRTRITFHHDLPVTLSTSWLPAELATAAPALLDKARIEGGTIGLIKALTGRSVVRGTDQLRARGANGDVARYLRVGEGAPVLYGTNSWFDADDLVLEFGEFWVPADRGMTYHYPDARPL